MQVEEIIKMRNETAKEMMYQVYGDPHRVIEEYWKKTKTWLPYIKPGDPDNA